jgi:hypothetical protein
VSAAALVSVCLMRIAVGDVTSYETSVRSEARARMAEGQTESNVEIDPSAAVHYESRSYSLAASYAPVLLWDDPLRLQAGTTSQLQVLHNGGLTGNWRVEPRWVVTLDLTGSYGKKDLLAPDANEQQRPPVQGTPTPPTNTNAQATPADALVPWAAASVMLGTGGWIGTRTTTNLAVRGFLQGGATPEARVGLPLQRGATFLGELDVDAVRSGHFTTALSSTFTSFTGDAVDPHKKADGLTLLTETWRNEIARGTTVVVGAGPSLITEHFDTGGVRWSLSFGGQAGITYDMVYPAIQTGFTVTMTPQADPLSGIPYNRADGTLTLGYRPTTGWNIGTAFTAGVVTDGALAGQKLANGDVHVTWSERDAWSVSGGLALNYQNARGEVGALEAVPALTAWTFFLNVRFRDAGRF